MSRVDRERLRTLVTGVSQFYTTDRKLRRAQEKMGALLARDSDPSPRAVRGYLKVVSRYFSGFDREARVHLVDIERRLAHVSQLQFNLTAERGVAVRRIELTQGVLKQLAEIEKR